MAKRRGLPAFELPVPSPIFGQIVIVLFGVPVQLAVNVPDVAEVPPTLKFTLPKLMSVIAKLQDWAEAVPADKTPKSAEITIGLSGIAKAQQMFAFPCRP